MHAILLATAALVGVPILLHLLMKQEPKRLPFPALRFLIAKKKTNQRKLKLRHWLLLALRMLLIALFGLAIFQPILPSAGLDFGVTLSGEQPVACVVVIDTSPSMGYVSNGQTRLAEAKRRALELLDDLPANSKVAVIDPAEPGATWEQSVADARRRIEGLREPHGAAVPLTSALAAAYSLLKTVDQEAEATEPLPWLVAIFSDRTTACWDASRSEDLVRLRDSIPKPAVAHLFADVGVDAPTDLAITAIDFKPQVAPQNRDVVLNVTLSATGPGAETLLKLKVTPAGPNAPTVDDQSKAVVIPANGSTGAAFTIAMGQLRPGLYQAELKLDTPDSLPFNNTRFVTFKVAEPRKILTISDDPAEAEYWRLAHEVVGEFECVVQKPADAADFAKFEIVCVMNVTDPTPLWPRLLEYAEAGGKVVLAPGAERNVAPAAWSPTAGDAAARLLPAKLGAVVSTADPAGVPWVLDDDALRHPMLNPMKDWKLKGNVDVMVRPRRAWKFWDAQPLPETTVVARYADNDDPAKRHVAVIEKVIGAKGGKVLMTTTRLDPPETENLRWWNDYFENVGNTWPIVLPNLIARHLAGNTADAVFNFATGQALPLPLPRGGAKSLRIEGPGVTARDTEIALDGKQAELRLPVARMMTAGSFKLYTPDKAWTDGFSLNPPAEESNLAKVPVDGVEGLLGKGSVVPVDRKLNLRDVLKLKYDQPLELFPWLLIAVLLLMTFEGYVANRFYRSRK